MTKIFHWVPFAENPRWPCVDSWINMELPEGATKTFYRSHPNNVRYSWNKAAEDFLASGSDWLFSTHNDVVFAPKTLTRLLSWQEPVISALIFMRQSPVVPHIWKSYEDEQRYVLRIEDTRDWFYAHKEWIKFGPFVMDEKPIDALTPVSFTSTSCTLVHRTVIEKTAELCGRKWFEWDNDFTGGGEDRRFFEYCQQAGFIPMVDRSCVVGHVVGDIATSVADFIVWDSASSFIGTGERKPAAEAV